MSADCCNQINCLTNNLTKVAKYLNAGDIKVNNLIPLSNSSTIGTADNKFCEIHTRIICRQ